MSVTDELALISYKKVPRGYRIKRYGTYLTLTFAQMEWLINEINTDESNDRTNLDMAAEIKVRDRRITELEEELEEAWKPNRCRDAIAAHNRRGNKT